MPTPSSPGAWYSSTCRALALPQVDLLAPAISASVVPRHLQCWFTGVRVCACVCICVCVIIMGEVQVGLQVPTPLHGTAPSLPPPSPQVEFPALAFSV